MRKPYCSGLLICVLLSFSFSCAMNSYRRVAIYHDATEVLFETMASIYQEFGYEIVKQRDSSGGSEKSIPFITGRQGGALVTSTFKRGKSNTEVKILVTRVGSAGHHDDLQKIHDKFLNKFSEKVYPSPYSSKRAYSPKKSKSVNRTIYTGPRGGKYYINSKGKKVYIKKK